jgi:hypothetical protein
MISTIDTDPVSLLYEQTTQLDGIEYLMSFLWADRESAWYLSIYDQNQNQIALCIRLVVSSPLLKRFVDPRLPPGLLFCCDMTGNGVDIEESTDLGTRVLLAYATVDEL